MKKILLIEDNDDVRENTAEILELSNYRVVTAPNGKQGIALALQELPDLIICDIMMPELDGYGVLHALHKHPQTAAIPFIFLTAKSEKTDFRKGMGMGADDYITKPFDGTELLNAVESRLKKTAAIKQLFSQDIKGVTEFLDSAQQSGHVQLTSEEREVNSYKKKQVLYTEGQRPVAVYFVVSGKVLVRKSNEDSKEFVTDICIPGDFFGFTAMLEEINYREAAEFLEDSELMIIPKKDFLELINHDQQVAKQFIRLLAKNVSDKEERLVNLAYNSLRKKVANGLLHLAEKFRESGPVIEISREHLAHIVGSATESLIRTLSDFKAEKMIDIKGSRIMILDEKRLVNLIG
ncbi:response regulator [Sediminibacterium soli]|uniref:response regulator n=1 Tax=Sediminibacterium soli TaxID=2698829 RepID=UPI00137B68E1|nr:response regulator [Sediminibacterium soli]NCI45674.1 response regulator [Sediminibacterium soli]